MGRYKAESWLDNTHLLSALEDDVVGHRAPPAGSMPSAAPKYAPPDTPTTKYRMFNFSKMATPIRFKSCWGAPATAPNSDHPWWDPRFFTRSCRYQVPDENTTCGSVI